MPKVEKKNGWLIIGGIAIALIAALIGAAAGYNLKPVAKTDDLVVTEDVCGKKNGLAGNTGSGDAAVPVKAYTQITDILDNARHVVEERFYASDGSIVACEQSYFDADGDRARCAQLHSIQRFEYDALGRQTLTSWFTVNEEPFVNTKGYVSMATVYAPDGSKTDTYYDADGNEVTIE